MKLINLCGMSGCGKSTLSSMIEEYLSEVLLDNEHQVLPDINKSMYEMLYSMSERDSGNHMKYDLHMKSYHMLMVKIIADQCSKTDDSVIVTNMRTILDYKTMAMVVDAFNPVDYHDSKLKHDFSSGFAIDQQVKFDSDYDEVVYCVFNLKDSSIIDRKLEFENTLHESIFSGSAAKYSAMQDLYCLKIKDYISKVQSLNKSTKYTLIEQDIKNVDSDIKELYNKIIKII